MRASGAPARSGSTTARSSSTAVPRARGGARPSAGGALAAALVQGAVLCGLAAAFARLDAAVLALAALSSALCAGEIALAPKPGLPIGALRAPGWMGPAAATGLGLLALLVTAALWRSPAGATLNGGAFAPRSIPMAVSIAGAAPELDGPAARLLLIGHGALALAGVAGMVLGGGLRLWAIRTLGESFRTEHEVHEGQRLVRSGPYALTRHPSEIGLLAFALGAAALMGSWPAAAIWAFVLLPASVLRVRREEALLRAAFGPRYTA